MLTRLTVDYGLGAYVATYCILYGIGLGFPYSVIYSIASSVGTNFTHNLCLRLCTRFKLCFFVQWFPQHRATVVGIIASGFGLGALIFTPIQTAVINPDNLAANKSYVVHA